MPLNISIWKKIIILIFQDRVGSVRPVKFGTEGVGVKQVSKIMWKSFDKNQPSLIYSTQNRVLCNRSCIWLQKTDKISIDGTWIWTWPWAWPLQMFLFLDESNSVTSKIFLWIIWHLKGKLCNGVFDYLLKVLSPFNAPKVVHRINTQHNNGNFENFPKRKWRLKNTWDDRRLSHSQREPT